jgi:hypothetical protein
MYCFSGRQEFFNVTVKVTLDHRVIYKLHGCLWAGQTFLLSTLLHGGTVKVPNFEPHVNFLSFISEGLAIIKMRSTEK